MEERYLVGLGLGSWNTSLVVRFRIHKKPFIWKLSGIIFDSRLSGCTATTRCPLPLHLLQQLLVVEAQFGFKRNYQCVAVLLVFVSARVLVM